MVKKTQSTLYISDELTDKIKAWEIKNSMGFKRSTLLEILGRSYFDIDISLKELTVDRRKIDEKFKTADITPKENLEVAEAKWKEGLLQAYTNCERWVDFLAELWGGEMRIKRGLDPMTIDEVDAYIAKNK